jgi:hypothetical protein
MCAIFKDEAPYLAEWVTFHRLMGVERFFLYDNGSSDDWERELAPELDSGAVEVVPWPQHPGQLGAYADCLDRHRHDARWIAFLDIDEFLFSPAGDPLPTVLRRYAYHPAVAVNWRVYGTGGWTSPPPGLVTESYRLRASDEHPVSRHVKSIVYPRKTSTAVWSPHIFPTRGFAVGEDGRPVTGPFRDPATADVLRINHYFSKSEEELRRKLGRQRSDIGERYPKDVTPRAELPDDTILRFVPALKKALAAR